MDSFSSLPDPVIHWAARFDEVCGRNHAAWPSARETAILLIVYYLIFMIAGDLAAYFIGLSVEYEWGSQASLIVFLALYFLFLWVSWLLAVWLTKPRGATQSAS
jgi:cation transporter-like permease